MSGKRPANGKEIYMQIHRSCPICGGESRAYSHQHCFEPIDNVSLLSKINVVVCGECGMAYADSIPAQETMDLYYKNFSKYVANTSSSTWKESDQIALDFIYDQPVEKSALIADIGCGQGKILKELKRNGYNGLIGIELSDANCGNLLAAGIAAINKSLFDVAPDDLPGKLDCIILMDVLEHVAGLRSAVRQILKLLDSGGTVIISVPCLDSFDGRDPYPFEQISMEHVNYFTLNSLELLMKLNGFELKEHKAYESNLTAVFRRAAASAPMREYIAECGDFLLPTVQLIDRYAQSQKPIIIYGSGTLSQYLLANTNLKKCNILYVVDGNANYHGHYIGSHMIRPPSTLTDVAFRDADIFTVSYHFNDEITAGIKGMGLSNTIINLPVNE